MKIQTGSHDSFLKPIQISNILIVTKKHLDNRDILPIFVHTNKASLLHTLGRTGFGSGFSSNLRVSLYSLMYLLGSSKMNKTRYRKVFKEDV